MVSLKTAATLGLIGAAVLGFYKLGGASGIGSKLGGGVSSLFDSFTGSLSGLIPDKSSLDYNPALNPLAVASARLGEAATLDPNLAADRFVDPTGKYDPFSVAPIPEPFDQGMKEETRTPIITRLPTIENFPTVYASPPTPQATFVAPIAPYIGVISPQPQTPQQQQDVINQNPLSYIPTNNRGLNSSRSTRYG